MALERAWRRIKDNGLRSRSADTRDAVRAFDADSRRHLNRIARELHARRFEFAPQTGVVKRKKGKGRPLVIGPLANRIVQRAILDQLLAVPAVQDLHATRWSFGGVPGLDRRAAFREVFRAIDNGARWYVRSDIADFFGNIPRALVTQWVGNCTDDAEFLDLFCRAIAVDLENLDALGDDAGLFPLTDGVAQGSPLSALIGNILLHDFDLAMNKRGLVCLRYIDDFLILGPSQRHVLRGFVAAQRMLGALSPGLRAYDPRDGESKKASLGLVENGVDFLGCTLRPGQVLPSRAARRAFLVNLEDMLDSGLGSLRVAATAEGSRVPKKRLVQILADVDNVIRGWIDSVRFCTDIKMREELDRKIDEKLDRFDRAVRQLFRQANPAGRRRIRGLQLLTDRPYDSIKLEA